MEETANSRPHDALSERCHEYLGIVQGQDHWVRPKALSWLQADVQSLPMKPGTQKTHPKLYRVLELEALRLFAPKTASEALKFRFRSGGTAAAPARTAACGAAAL